MNLDSKLFKKLGGMRSSSLRLFSFSSQPIPCRWIEKLNFFFVFSICFDFSLQANSSSLYGFVPLLIFMGLG